MNPTQFVGAFTTKVFLISRSTEFMQQGAYSDLYRTETSPMGKLNSPFISENYASYPQLPHALNAQLVT